MLNKIKLSLKMTRYTLNRKSTFTSMILFFILGLGMECVRLYSPADSGAAALGSYYFAIVAMFMGQMVFLTTVSKLVQCSPKKRILQVECVPLISTLCSVIMYTLLVVITYIGIRISPVFETSPEAVNIIKMDLLIMGFFALILEIYCGIVYKAFWITTIIFMAILIPIILGSMYFIRVKLNLDYTVGLSTGTVVAISYGLIIIGYPIARLLAALTYKLDISPSSYKTALQKSK